ncbi:MAG: hypothetical protein HY365_00965 [Candidatus Aenigmarchaeota archaeon]|nr:hypothetical protein [Candidatus Aenigmarchaeota archaeon]
MKGSSLPVNTIVVVAIAILVMMVIGGFFALNVGQGVNTIELNNAITNACNVLRTTYNCNVGSLASVEVQFKELGQESENPTSLERLCTLSGLSAGADFAKQCAAKCGCGTATVTTLPPPEGGF